MPAGQKITTKTKTACKLLKPMKERIPTIFHKTLYANRLYGKSSQPASGGTIAITLQTIIYCITNYITK